MIIIRIPQEIRKYKEKIAFGLTVRQIISVIIALGVCVPLYWFGRHYIPSNILGWLIILVAMPLGGIGFFKYNGMHLEKLVIVVLKQQFIMPFKRYYKSENHFLGWQKEYEKSKMPKSVLGNHKHKKAQYQASLEKTVLMEEAVQRGELGFDVSSQELITVKYLDLKSIQKGRKGEEDLENI